MQFKTQKNIVLKILPEFLIFISILFITKNVFALDKLPKSEYGKKIERNDFDFSHSSDRFLNLTYNKTDFEEKILIKTFKTAASVLNGSFENGLNSWAVTGFAQAANTATLNIPPTDQENHAFLRNTGVNDIDVELFLGMPVLSLDGMGNGNAVTGSAIKATFTAQTQGTLSFNWNHLTNEGTPSSFNDFSFYTVYAVGAGGNPIELADSNFSPYSPSGSFAFAQQTQYRTVSINLAAGNYVLGFGVMNVLDASVSSGVLIDNIRFCPSFPFFNSPPSVVANPVNITVNEDTPNSVISLFANFSDFQEADIDLVYSFSILSQNPVNPSDNLFTSIVLNRNAGTLTLNYTPNIYGTALIRVNAADRCGGSVFADYNITVNSVNDAPDFIMGSNQVVNEDAGPQTIVAWASNISKGPANESSQKLSFITSVSISGGDLAFTSSPAIDANTGTLTYTTSPNTFGKATVVVVLQDDGTGAGFNQTVAKAFTITVNSVNDAPDFNKGSDIIVNEDIGEQIFPGWATGIAKGAANESSQVLSFTSNITLSGNLSFISFPSIDANTGTLTFRPTPNTSGTATLTLTLKDDGGTSNGGIDESLAQQFTIEVIEINDAPTLANINFNLEIVPNSGEQTVPLTGISAGPNETQVLQISAVSDNPGLIPNPTIVYTSPASTGSLKFTPAAGQSGAEATITVTVLDDGGTASGGINTISKTFKIKVESINVAPTLDPLANISIVQNKGQQTITLTGISAGGGQNQVLNIAAISSNPALIPNPNITYTSPNSIGTLKFTSAPNQTGSVLITVTVSDNGSTANGGINTFVRQFAVNVLPTAPNTAPTLSAIADTSIVEAVAEININLSGISAGGTDMNNLTVIATSNDTLLIPHPTVNYTSPNPNGNLIIMPISGRNGSAIITVTVKDDGGTLAGSFDAITKTFKVTLNLVNALETLPDSFVEIYPNPSTGKFILDTKDLFFDKGLIRIYSVLGKTIYQGSINHSQRIYELLLNDTTSGMYFLEISEGTKRLLKRIVKY